MPYLDPSLPPVPQRIHGDQNAIVRIEEPYHVSPMRFIKPIVVRPLNNIRFIPGNHGIEGYVKISPEFYMGVHWQMADPSIAIKRKLQCKDRLSQRNKALGFSWPN